MTSQPKTQDVAVRVVDDVAQWDSLQDRWTELWRASLTSSAPLRWEWLRHWWRIYGETYGLGGLRILLIERGPELVGAVPLYVGRDARNPVGPLELRFLSTGEDRSEETCAAYLDILCRPGEEETCATHFFQALASGVIKGWDRLELSCVAPQSALLAPRNGVAAKCSWVPERQSPCMFADLEGGFEAYLGRLSTNTRAQARRLLRSMDGRLTFSLATTSDEIDLFYQQLVTLHQLRWQQAGEAGVFASQRFTEFHHALIRQLAPSGDAVVARLSVDGRPLAVIQGYVTGQRFDYYLAGTAIDETVIKSPGVAAHLCLLKFMAERGITKYDYLHGYSRFKEQYSTGSQDIWQMTFERRTLRNVASTLWRTGKKAAREVQRAAYRAVGSQLGLVVISVCFF